MSKCEPSALFYSLWNWQMSLLLVFWGPRRLLLYNNLYVLKLFICTMVFTIKFFFCKYVQPDLFSNYLGPKKFIISYDDDGWNSMNQLVVDGKNLNEEQKELRRELSALQRALAVAAVAHVFPKKCETVAIT